jgi:GxxExxY protein
VVESGLHVNQSNVSRGQVFEPLTEREEAIATMVVEAAYTIHQTLGPGLLESIYEPCFCHELNKRGLATQCQVRVPIVYDGLSFTDAFRLDVLIEQLVICEVKAAEAMHPVYLAQLLTYLKLTGHCLGFIINFNVPTIKQGIKRVVR